jgi:predicted unusual protein kinase regulating ubiquinone biosynthesis (AarF/ABC1/UbiB family)
MQDSSLNNSLKDNVRVPKAHTTISTSRLLVMDWVEGKPLLEVGEQLSQAQKNELGRQLFRAWYRPFYLKGWIHGDPHPGNYSISADNTLHIFDFGCVRMFDDNFITGVIDLYQALKTNDQALARSAYERWGFSNLSDEIMQAMTRWARLLYDPLLDDNIRPIQKDHSGEVGWNTAVEVHRLLEAHGGIRVPNSFVFMDRAAVGVGSVLMRLGFECNWHQLFEEILAEMKLC